MAGYIGNKSATLVDGYTKAELDNHDLVAVDATGNVGIGTSSPILDLHVEGNAVGGSTGFTSGRSLGAKLTAYSNSVAVEDVDALYLRKEGTNDSTVGIAFGNANGDSPFVGARIKHYRTGSNSNGDLVFETKGDSSTNTTVERMRIDSAGRVTMPYQPAFQVGFGATSFPTNQATNTFTIFGDTVGTYGVTGANFDRGGNINTSNGRFTAPVSGVYNFAINIAVANGDNTEQNNQLELYLNGVSHHNMEMEVESTAMNPMIYNMVINVPLTQGDYVTIGTKNLDGGNDFTLLEVKWSGHLIG